MTERTDTVSERDRDYFRRLAKFNAQCDADHRKWWFAKTLDERAEVVSARVRAHKAEYFEEESAEEFYRRARRLGLYIA